MREITKYDHYFFQDFERIFWDYEKVWSDPQQPQKCSLGIEVTKLLDRSQMSLITLTLIKIDR